MTDGVEPKRVLLVEDEFSAHARCVHIVNAHPRLELVAEAYGFRTARRLLDERGAEFDLLLTDLQLGDGDGADLIRLWRESGDRPAMVISVFGDVTSVIRAVEAGANGYLLKGGSDREMLDSLTTVIDGGAPISAAVAGHLLRRVRGSAAIATKPETAPKTQLSHREVEVLSGLARGGTYKEVARDMGISPHTVGDHVKNIYSKLAVSSRGEAVYQALRDGLIDIGPS